MVIDEPANLGGTNHGPNPVEYVLAAYAGCLNVMAHVCAKELGFELNGIQIDLVGNLNPDRLFGKLFDERAGFKGIKVVLKPDCHIDKETQDVWLKSILDRCPVGDNLKNTTTIEVDVKEMVCGC